MLFLSHGFALKRFRKDRLSYFPSLDLPHHLGWHFLLLAVVSAPVSCNLIALYHLNLKK